MPLAHVRIDPDARALPGLGPLQRQELRFDQIGEFVDQDAAIVGRADADEAAQLLGRVQGHEIDRALVVAIVELRVAEAP